MLRSLTTGALLLASACATTDGTPTVLRLTLVEDFRIGGADTGKASFTGIVALQFDRGGQIWLVDRQSPELRVFDAKGEYVRTAGRAGGQGPGEIEATNGFAFAPGGLVWVPDYRNRRYSLFDSSGNFISSKPDLIRSYGYMWEGGIDGEGRLYDRILVRTDTSNQQVLRRFADTSLIRIDSLPYPSCASGPRRRYALETKHGGMYMPVPFDANEVGAFDRIGNYWCSNGSTPGAVLLAVESGDTLATIGYDRPRLPVPQGSRDSAVARIRGLADSMGASMPDFSLIPEFQPAVTGVKVDDRDRVWLRVPHPTETRYDLFDRTGRQLAEVAVPFRIYPYAPLAVRGDTLLAVVLDEDDVPTILRLHLAPAAATP
jgi:sugar lactone lactonase YvrE